MLKKTLIAAVAVSLMAFGATVADAKSGGGGGGGGGGGHGGGGGGHGGGGGGHGGGGGGGGHGGGGGGGHGGGHHGGGHHKFHRYNNFWWGYAYSPSCYYETRKVRIKVRDRWGNTYRRWVWRDVKVCN